MCGSLSLGQVSRVLEAIVMPTQSASDSVETPEYEATICVLQDLAVGFVNDKMPRTLHSARSRKLW